MHRTQGARFALAHVIHGFVELLADMEAVQNVQRSDQTVPYWSEA